MKIGEESSSKNIQYGKGKADQVGFITLLFSSTLNEIFPMHNEFLQRKRLSICESIE